MAAQVGRYFEQAHYSDVHGPLMLMWQGAQAGLTLYDDPAFFFPENIGRDDYNYHRSTQLHSPITGLIGFSGFSGKYFGSYVEADTRYRYSSDPPTRYQVQLRVLSRQIRAMQAKTSTTFRQAPYWEIEPGPGDVLYCDPPYAGTTGYTTGAFDHDAFWDWCRAQAEAGVRVFVSEYQAPEDFVPVWEGKKRVTLNHADNNRVAVERLFVPASQASTPHTRPQMPKPIAAQQRKENHAQADQPFLPGL